jgi:hypothetical protein
MRKGVLMIIALALVLLVPSAMLLAQGKAPRAQEKTTVAKLTDEQKAQIKQLRMDQRMKAIDLRAELEKQGIMLRKELMKDQPSTADIEVILKKISDSRLKLQMLRIEGMLEMRKLLGPDWKMHMKGLRMRMGPGAMGEMRDRNEMGEAGEGMMGMEGHRAMAPMAGWRTRGQMGQGRRMVIMRERPGDRMQMRMMERTGRGTEMRGMGEGSEMHKEAKGRVHGSMSGGCMMEKTGAAGSCSSKSGGWQHRSQYRPRHWNAGHGMGAGCATGGAHQCSSACKKTVKVEVKTEE